MKKRLLALFILPLVLTSCGKSELSIEQMKEAISGYSTENVYPYYRVIGSLDFNNQIIEVNHLFDQTPNPTKFVPYARYNDGFYNSTLDYKDESEEIVIYGMASHSYWLRAPMRINSKNFYVEEKDDEGNPTGHENDTCAHYALEHLITSYVGQSSSANPSYSSMEVEKLEGGGIAFFGNNVHTTVTIDNYPYYPDYDNIKELGEWKKYNPLPCYLNTVNVRVNIRFEYNSDGWLVKEEMATTDYNYSSASARQVALKAVYSYSFGS